MNIQKLVRIAVAVGLAGLVIVVTARPAPAQMFPGVSIKAASAPPQPRGAIPLPAQTDAEPSTLPGESWITVNGGRPAVRNVTQPTLTPFLPPPGKATGAAVVIAPGGGYMMLSVDSEGWSVARWLAERGVAAFVLKYRLKPTPAGMDAFMGALGTMLSGAASKASEGNGQLAAFPPSIDDAEAAMRLIRAKAADWHVDPKRVGMIGFSAGAITTVALGVSAPPDARPDFIAPIYGWMKAIDVPADAPPMFIALAADDPLMGRQGYGIVESWQKANRPIELHVYERGGHGFGADGMPGTTSTHWKEELNWWLESRGLLKKTS